METHKMHDDATRRNWTTGERRVAAALVVFLGLVSLPYLGEVHPAGILGLVIFALLLILWHRAP